MTTDKASFTIFQRFWINVLKCGEVPKHIAIIMDGNRRYAKTNNLPKLSGHERGYVKLTETLRWCSELGVKEVTVYAFSIENFKRSKEEVDALMALTKEKIKELSGDKGKLESKGFYVRIVGDLDIVPDDFRRVIAREQLSVNPSDKAVLNVAFSYTSRNEMMHAIRTVVDGVTNGEITIDDIDEQLLNDCLFTNRSTAPDMLIRTSGEVRFSDFLLWQIGNSQIHFVDIYWPQFNVWNLMAAVFQYQRSCKSKPTAMKQKVEYNEAVGRFLENVNKRRFEQMKKYAGMN